MITELSAADKDDKDKEPFLGIKDFPYTQKQIDDLENSVEYKRHKYSIKFSNYTRKLSKSENRKFEKKKETAFRFGIYLIKDGKKYYRGRCEIYILDTESKKVVEEEKMSFKKLCPS